MRLAVAYAVLACASGCQIVFPLDEVFDVIPHVKQADELVGDQSVTVPAGEIYMINTDADTPVGAGFGSVKLIPLVQDSTGDIAVGYAALRVDKLEVDGTLRVTGSVPLIVLANSIVINGTLDASGFQSMAAGPGGGRPEMGDDGQGTLGSFNMQFDGNTGGGGGGGNAPGAGDGGQIDCLERSATGGKAGKAINDDELTLLQGGGAGGKGGSQCTTNVANGGAGGGALQLTAIHELAIGAMGKVLAGGGGGDGGLSGGICPAPGGGADGGGGGGGAGGSIYVDAFTITNKGLVQARGGGGGAGGRSTGDTIPGQRGFDATAAMNASNGGFGQFKGQSGGDGATTGTAEPGDSRMCVDFDNDKFDAGGGGGAPGRIVFRGQILDLGTVSPPPVQLVGRPLDTLD